MELRTRGIQPLIEAPLGSTLTQCMSTGTYTVLGKNLTSLYIFKSDSSHHHSYEICHVHVIRSRSIAASRRPQEGGPPHPPPQSWLIMCIPTFLRKVASFTPLLCQSGYFWASLTPFQSIVWFLLMTWSINDYWWTSKRCRYIWPLPISYRTYITANWKTTTDFLKDIIEYQGF